MVIKLNLIAAVCENMGIGKNNNLPWKLKTEMAYFTKMTSQTKSPAKKNVVIMGRKTWDSIPNKFKPLVNRINFVLSRGEVNLEGFQECYAFKSLEDAINQLEDDVFRETFENVWVIGGSHIYKESMKNKYFFRLYMTQIKKHFDCDTFFPELKNNLKEIRDVEVSTEEQEENGVKFLYKIYQNVNYES